MDWIDISAVADASGEAAGGGDDDRHQGGWVDVAAVQRGLGNAHHQKGSIAAVRRGSLLRYAKLKQRKRRIAPHVKA
eukprot:1119042-Pyramimonas_sp.AAC.1